MALKETWHKAMVYFGLAEERSDYYEEDFEEYASEDDVPERPRERSSRRLGRKRKDEIDDIFADDTGEHKTQMLHAVRGIGRNGGSDVRVHLVVPKSFNDAQQIADKFKDSMPVIVNIQGADSDLSKRLIDFASGLTYALDGGMQRIADKTFLLTPRNVKVSAQERARLIEQNFFNQS